MTIIDLGAKFSSCFLMIFLLTSPSPKIFSPFLRRDYHSILPFIVSLCRLPSITSLQPVGPSSSLLSKYSPQFLYLSMLLSRQERLVKNLFASTVSSIISSSPSSPTYAARHYRSQMWNKHLEALLAWLHCSKIGSWIGCGCEWDTNSNV
jgi:hypothetical protein